MTGTLFLQENATALVFYQFFSPAQLFFLSCFFIMLLFLYLRSGWALGTLSNSPRGSTNVDADSSDDSHSPIARVIAFLLPDKHVKHVPVETPLKLLRFISVGKKYFFEHNSASGCNQNGSEMKQWHDDRSVDVSLDCKGQLMQHQSHCWCHLWCHFIGSRDDRHQFVIISAFFMTHRWSW